MLLDFPVCFIFFVSYLFLEVNTPCYIQNARVTLIDANHCPGAAIFLFEIFDISPNVSITEDISGSSAYIDSSLLQNFQAPYSSVNLPWPSTPPFYSLTPPQQLLALKDPLTGELPEPTRISLHTGDFRASPQLEAVLRPFLRNRVIDGFSLTLLRSFFTSLCCSSHSAVTPSRSLPRHYLRLPREHLPFTRRRHRRRRRPRPGC